MCGVCGCGEGETRIESAHVHEHDHEHEHVLPDGRVVRHSHGHAHPDREHAETEIAAKTARLIAVERDILARNDTAADHNRAHFAAHRTLALNLVSSPGAGKTTLLVATIQALASIPVAVIEGDQQTSLDADRIRATGAPAIQINTGKGCHLEADAVGKAYDRLHLAEGILFIENVGNLVCPAGFNLGESHRVVLASVAEGDDKPLKYPDIFASADLLLVTKVEIAEACGADVTALIANARKVKPDLPAITLSARTGEGMDRWIAWLKGALAMRQAAS